MAGRGLCNSFHTGDGSPVIVGGAILNIKSLAQLRALLFEMETTLGLVDLSQNERDVLYAINEVSGGAARAARSEAIRNHPLAAAIPQATYHRALKSLVQRGLVGHAPDTRAGQYVILAKDGDG